MGFGFRGDSSKLENYNLKNHMSYWLAKGPLIIRVDMGPFGSLVESLVYSPIDPHVPYLAESEAGKFTQISCPVLKLYPYADSTNQLPILWSLQRGLMVFGGWG